MKKRKKSLVGWIHKDWSVDDFMIIDDGKIICDDRIFLKKKEAMEYFSSQPYRIKKVRITIGEV